MPSPKQPLSGLRVLDFTQLILGPAATQILGDFGADVIKIERPHAGDLSRDAVAGDRAGQNHPLFCSYNRNKRSISIDLSTLEGRKLVRAMVKKSDIVVHNFRNGVMERMGLDYDSLVELNPQIILAVGTGFGSGGPYADKGGQDSIIQGMTGALLRSSGADEVKRIPPLTVADYAGAMHLAQGILLAVLQREKTGESQHVEVSLYDSMLAVQSIESAMQLMRGENFSFSDLPVRGVFESSDGLFIMLAGWNPEALTVFCKALEIPDLSLDPRFRDTASQMRNRTELHAIFKSHFVKKPTSHWMDVFERNGILCGPVLTLAEALVSEQAKANQIIWSCESDYGDVSVIGSPIRLPKSNAQMHRPPPTLNQHGQEVLREFGLSVDHIDKLVQSGVVG